MSSSNEGKDKCTTTTSVNYEIVSLQSQDPDVDGVCRLKDHGRVTCGGYSTTQSWINTGEGEDASNAYSRSDTDLCAGTTVHYCDIDGEISDNACGCSPSVSWSIARTPQPADTATARYISWNVYTGVSTSTNPSGNISLRSYTLERLERPATIPTANETRDYLIGKLPVEPNGALAVASFSSQAVVNQQPKVSISKVDITFEHEPTGTCYLKVWFKAVYSKKATGVTLISDYDLVYEWEDAENPCINGTPSSTTVPSPDVKIVVDKIITLDVPEEEGTVYLYVYKYSIIKGYEPDDPILNVFGNLVRPSPDLKPNCTPNGGA